MPGPESTRKNRDNDRPAGRRRSPAQANKDAGNKDAGNKDAVNKDAADRDARTHPRREEEVSRLLSLSQAERTEAVLELQRRYGNRRVQRMLARLVQPEALDVSASLPGQALAPQAEEEGQGDPNQVAPEVVDRIEGQQGSGSPLTSDTRTEMEDAFGHDFGDVRVHTGSEADTLNQEVQARAFTTGSDIFFREGTYSPGSPEGKELLAHELTHVVQQSGAPASASGPARVTSPDDATEVEAAKVAESIMHQGEIGRQGQEEEELQMARQGLEEEEELQMARQGQEEEEEELQMARQAEEEEEMMMARQVEERQNVTLARGIFDTIGKGINSLLQKLGYKLGTGGSKRVLESTFEGVDFDVSNVTVLNEAGIKKAWDDRYGEGSYDGSNGQAEGPDGPLEGFTDVDTGEIFINKDAQEVDTVPHEILHKHEDGAVHAQMGERFNEGITEYLTQKAVSGAGFEPSSSYPDELRITQKLAGIVGDSVIEKAYFNGDVDSLKTALDDNKGAGTFDEVVAAMKAEDYGKAGTTLDTGVPAPAPVGS